MPASTVARCCLVGIRLGIDGESRWMDNAFVASLWRSLEYADVHLKAHEAMAEARYGMATYFGFYNRESRGQGPNRQTPHKVYEGRRVLPGGLMIRWPYLGAEYT